MDLWHETANSNHFEHATDGSIILSWVWASQYVHLAAVRVISAYASWLAAEEWAPLGTTTPVWRHLAQSSKVDQTSHVRLAVHLTCTQTAGGGDNLNRRGRASADSSDVQNFVPVRVITTASVNWPCRKYAFWYSLSASLHALIKHMRVLGGPVTQRRLFHLNHNRREAILKTYSTNWKQATAKQVVTSVPHSLCTCGCRRSYMLSFAMNVLQ